VLVHSHDIGRHLGCYGRGVSTPRIDAVAEEGLRFRECFCAAPTCTPSRAATNTGRYAHEVDLHGLVNRGWELDGGVPTLATAFRDAGYDTRLYGLQHVVPGTDANLRRIGYENAYTESTGALDVAAAFADDLGDAIGTSGDDPFLATLGFSEPHQPFRREEVDDDWYDYYHPDSVDPLPYLPDTRGVREDVAAMNALISGTVDPALGRIDEALRQAGIAEETLLVYTNDHGIAFPRAKGTLYDSGIEGTLLVRGPGVDSGTEDALLSNVDSCRR